MSLFLLLAVILCAIQFHLGVLCDHRVVFQFGDSLSDAGNSLLAFPGLNGSGILGLPPYGETFFKRATGRVTDGRLIIDFLASGMGVPFLDPYLDKASANFVYGANFATVGATALSIRDFYRKRNIMPRRPTFSFDTQLQWFHSFQEQALMNGSSAYSVPNLRQFREALYVIGEIGGNDYAMLHGSGVDFLDIIKFFVPRVVHEIEETIRELYQAGARNFLVINVPIQGCNVRSLATADWSKEEMDELGCLARFNEVGYRHKFLLERMVRKLRDELPGSAFATGDFLGITKKIFENYKHYGFTHRFEACCGIYNATTTVDCGESVFVNGARIQGPTCDDPSQYIFWNDNHFTEHFYEIVANAFLSGEFLDPPIFPKLSQTI
ncbi:hypothetical protein SELMODRAFT_110185 [Selaginella moellendorffii]|uniref:Uncharacterized protein n=1 Tax=Selaginella moellendorffii TaxID=88036 RepID=D8S7H8_SELML|nr:GDSL esterase/lipase At3g48460 [Selaginella moellendorffii]EFJ19610.1 hypothetical protein SELMODRAFT_110185 [Selaginella moellendorffii]|eukprot:XP_002979202.1 GDSL esterase/lipase At3g48460 [Selaginella moellendorffii]